MRSCARSAIMKAMSALHKYAAMVHRALARVDAAKAAKVQGSASQPEYLLPYAMHIVAHCTEKGEDGPPCLQVELPARRMRHPSIDLYFKGFNGEQGYLPKQALSRLYPDG